MRISLIKIIPPLILCAIFLAPSSAFAARIFFSSENIQAHVGDEIPVDVLLDTEQASVNAVDLSIVFPPLVSVKNISRSGSILSLWIQEPSSTARSILLQGGVPGGVVISRGVIAHLILRANAVGRGSLAFDAASTALLNDGAGTSAHLIGNLLNINVVAREADKAPAAATPLPSDTQRPVGFSISIGSDPSVFQGKNFASFYTTDKKSGMDHYEISEGRGVFRVARSPFLLADQKLHSVILVRAYDAAGNWREEVWPGIFRRFWWWIIGIFGFH
jgi:hypothetical protein